MGVEVVDQPHWAVQFHPESILISHGESMIETFWAPGSDSSSVAWRTRDRVRGS